MKIQTAIIVLCLFSQCLLGQLQTGSLFLGGNLYFQYDSNDPKLQLPVSGNDSRTTYSLTASTGFFLSPKFALGAGVQYYRESAINSFVNTTPQPSGPYISNKVILSRWSFKPFIRQYVPFTEKTGLLLEAEVNAGLGSYKSPLDDFPIDADLYHLGIHLRPAFYYFANNRMCLEAGLGSLSFFHTIMDNALNEFGTQEGDSATSLGFNLSESLGISFKYFLINKSL